MNAVGSVATISGFVVGFAGVISNVAIAWLRRGEEVELAEKQHAHERELTQDLRLYERRAPVYESMMAIVEPAMEHVEARRSNSGSTNVEPPLPREPELEDQRAMQVELRTHSSQEVSDAFHDFVQKSVFAFQLAATDYEEMHSRAASSPARVRRSEDAREQAHKAADKLQRLVADKLASGDQTSRLSPALSGHGNRGRGRDGPARPTGPL